MILISHQDFAVKFNANTFKIQPATPELPINKVSPLYLTFTLNFSLG